MQMFKKAVLGIFGQGLNYPRTLLQSSRPCNQGNNRTSPQSHMKPYTMVLPSTALFGSSFGSMFLKTIGSSNASLLLILVFAFVITYSIGYLFMRRPEVSCGSEGPSCTAGGEQRAKESSSANGPTTSSGGQNDETTPLLEGSGDEEEEEEEEPSSSESVANEKEAN